MKKTFLLGILITIGFLQKSALCVTKAPKQTCTTCHSTQGTTQLSKSELETFLQSLPLWEYDGSKSIKRRVNFPNTQKMFLFIDRLTAIAEQQGHHPNLYVDFKRLTIELYTHSINNLTKNDFMLAKDIDTEWQTFEATASTIPDIPDPDTNCCFLSPAIPGFRAPSFKDVIDENSMPTGWIVERFGTYKWFSPKDFVTGADRLKKIVSYLIENHFSSYQISLLFYNSLRVDIKKQICQNKNAFELVKSFATNIDTLVSN